MGAKEPPLLLLLPIGQEDARFRRAPWVTFGIMILCAIAFVASGRAHPLAMQDERMQREVVGHQFDVVRNDHANIMALVREFGR